MCSSASVFWTVWDYTCREKRIKMSVDAEWGVMVPCCRKPSMGLKTLQEEWCPWKRIKWCPMSDWDIVISPTLRASWLPVMSTRFHCTPSPPLKPWCCYLCWAVLLWGSSHWLQQDYSWQASILTMSKQLYVCVGVCTALLSPLVYKSRNTCTLMQNSR